MSSSFHSHKAQLNRYTKRDPLASRKHGESIEDIDRACKIWLLKRCPGYREELEGRWRHYNSTLRKTND